MKCKNCFDKEGNMLIRGVPKSTQYTYDWFVGCPKHQSTFPNIDEAQAFAKSQQ